MRFWTKRYKQRIQRQMIKNLASELETYLWRASDYGKETIVGLDASLGFLIRTIEANCQIATPIRRRRVAVDADLALEAPDVQNHPQSSTAGRRNSASGSNRLESEAVVHAEEEQGLLESIELAEVH